MLYFYSFNKVLIHVAMFLTIFRGCTGCTYILTPRHFKVMKIQPVWYQQDIISIVMILHPRSTELESYMHLRKPSVFGPLRSPNNSVFGPLRSAINRGYSGSGVDRKHLACEDAYMTLAPCFSDVVS